MNTGLRYWKNGAWHDLQIGGGDYTAGDGISIQNNKISLDTDTTMLKQNFAADAKKTGELLSEKSDVGHTHTASEVSGIPSKVSQLTNDTGYITNSDTHGTFEQLANKVTSLNAQSDNDHYPSAKTVYDGLKTAYDGLSGKADASHTHTASDVSGLAKVATSGAYSDLSGKPNIPQKTSDLTNDSGFLTQVPNATDTTSGIVKPDSQSFVMNSDTLTLKRANDTRNAARTSGVAVTLEKLDSCVKAALCDGIGAAWSDAEKVAARTRLGADNYTVLWSGSQGIVNTFTLAQSASHFQYLAIVPSKAVGAPLLIIPGNDAFGGMVPTSGNYARMYFVLGQMTWNEDCTTVGFAWKLRFYKTSATAGSSSTIDVVVESILGFGRIT